MWQRKWQLPEQLCIYNWSGLIVGYSILSHVLGTYPVGMVVIVTNARESIGLGSFFNRTTKPKEVILTRRKKKVRELFITSNPTIKTIGLPTLSSKMAMDRDLLFEEWEEDLKSFGGYKKFLEALEGDANLPKPKW